MSTPNKEVQPADMGTADDIRKATAEERAEAVARLAALRPDVDPNTLTAREKLERGMAIHEDVKVTNDKEPNLKWVGVDEAGERTRKHDPPRDLHIGPYHIYFDDDALIALTGRGVYSEHAAIIRDSVTGFKRPEPKG
jgi:hypothetical protein